MGRLEKAPTAAALNAWTTIRIRSSGLRPVDGASSRPERAAKDDPMIQATLRVAHGDIPFNPRRLGDSTTARMATPTRVDRR